jgi:hypothetical protein
MSATKILLDQFDLHQALFNNALEDITNEESDTRMADHLNK